MAELRRRLGGSPEALLGRARKLAAAGRMAEALAIWRRLAEAGVPRAQANYGACFATGNGAPLDPAAARLWLRRGAEAGDSLGQRNLATLLLPEDPAAAASWYRRAGEQGDAASQDQLSRMLLASGPTQDLAEARRLAEQAARQGIAAAASRLGTMCHDAAGGPRDPAQAAHWWRVAAEAGDADAAAMLGAALHMGQGTPRDQVEAMAWLLVGSRRHSILVRPFLARVEAGLAPAELAAAEALAARRAG